MPGIFSRHGKLVDEALTVESREAVQEMRRMAREYGLFVGPSSGANLIAARKIQESNPQLKTIVTLFCDEGEKYISEHFAAEGRFQVNAQTFT